MMRRSFNYSDDVLIKYALDQLNFLEEDLTAFVELDADLGETKLADMQALADWALREGGDEQNVDQLGDLTGKVQEEMESCRLLFRQLRYWVIKAFPGRKAVQRQFGIGRFGRISDNQTTLLSFMISLVESVGDYRATLEATNAPASLLDGVEPQADALRDALKNQGKKRGSRPVDTEERIHQLNALHQHTRDYNAAAEHVFSDSPSKRERYRPPSHSSPLDVEEETED